ncbi:conserved hypothetical protein [Bacillus cereus Q1]|uniref:HipA-like C-terminal domain-containing protein n=1 Tax=Bacillus cereus (strain Q1) TaxID=361100 RepID=B9J2S0_BACCQ|nr:conserved hypothetical protein [Bacillus cereus Q1]
MELLEIKDISKWKIDNEKTASGTREKHWVKHPETGQLYLFKLPKAGTGEIWAEKIAAGVGTILGLETMDTEIAIYEGEQGILLKNFVEYGKEELFHGGDLLQPVVEEFDPRTLDDYNLDNIMQSLIPFNMEENFISICVFDALIANQDRHCENWGVIQRMGDVRFAPIYDNGASMGFNVAEEVIMACLKDEVRFKAFTNRSKTIIEVNGKRKPKIITLLDELKKRYPTYMQQNIEHISNLCYDNLLPVIDEVPHCIMSSNYKKWVVKLLLYRAKWLEQWYKGAV